MLRAPHALLAPALLLAAMTAMPTVAQFQSDSYKFLDAVKNAKGDEVMAMLNKPGANVINTRGATDGEGALHIVIRRGDATYLQFLLAKGADPNLRDGKGETPLMLAVTAGATDLIPLLGLAHANPNLANTAGETPLIRAVQRRDLAEVRALIALGANPDQTDVIAGKSARDYASQDSRNGQIAHLLAETPKRDMRGVAGPRL